VSASSNFIRDIIDTDLESGKHSKVVTRFPPEPNGYLHIGHAKSICLNFGLARDYQGVCHLRFDDTNPTTEDPEYVESIQSDIRWLGFEWDARLHASDYFEKLYQHACQLIRSGKAYVCSLDDAQIREYRGTVTEPGRNSPFRERSAEENLDLFQRMRAGEFPDGAHVLRAKIDMAAPNMKMRDPPLYRIRHAKHYRSGDDWCIYPLYDFTHCLSDAIEGITHSVCTLEFENNRELYDWVLDHTEEPARPQQIEFARLNLSYTVMSKRKLLQLVQQKLVSGWDDPRMPTISGMRRRGITAKAIRNFCDMIGVAKNNSTVDYGKLEYCIREDLNHTARRRMAVLDPLRVVITNYPEGEVEQLEAADFPSDVGKPGSRSVPFSRELYIERSDFMRDPPKKFHRLAPGREVRLRYGYLMRCDDVVSDDTGEVSELRCSIDRDTLNAAPADGRRVKGTIHWLSASHALPCEVRLYDRLFDREAPGSGDSDFTEHLNPASLRAIEQAWVEPSVKDDPPGSRYQFERQGYFCGDVRDSSADALVFNRTVTLRDSWAKLQSSEAQPAARASRSSETKAARPKAAPAAPDEPDEATLGPEYQRYRDEHGLSKQHAKRLAGDEQLATLFGAGLTAGAQAEGLAALVVGELAGLVKDGDASRIDGAGLAELLALVDDGTINATTAKEVLAEMVQRGGSPRAIVEAKGAQQLSDADALDPVIDEVIAAHPDEVQRYRDGKTALMGFFVGQVMRRTKGKANPKLLGERLGAKLGG
jgi:glutaminyl-tRNA synthetase